MLTLKLFYLKVSLKVLSKIKPVLEFTKYAAGSFKRLTLSKYSSPLFAYSSKGIATQGISLIVVLYPEISLSQVNTITSIYLEFLLHS